MYEPRSSGVVMSPTVPAPIKAKTMSGEHERRSRNLLPMLTTELQPEDWIARRTNMGIKALHSPSPMHATTNKSMVLMYIGRLPYASARDAQKVGERPWKIMYTVIVKLANDSVVCRS